MEVSSFLPFSTADISSRCGLSICQNQVCSHTFVLVDFAKKINRKTFFSEPSSSQWWGWHGGRNFRAMVFAMIRVHITGPPTNALAAILCTTGKMKASTGDRSTKGVSDFYSTPYEYIYVGKCAINRQIPKGTASYFETTAFPPEENNSSALLNTPE